MLVFFGTHGIPDVALTPRLVSQPDLGFRPLLTLTEGPASKDVGAGQRPPEGQAFSTKSQKGLSPTDGGCGVFTFSFI